MADDKEKEALDVVADVVLTSLANEINKVRLQMLIQGMVFSDRHWNEIKDRVMARTQPPDEEMFVAAYEFLDARADAE